MHIVQFFLFSSFQFGDCLSPWKLLWSLQAWAIAAVPNLWVATPRGVAIDFHRGRHWSPDIKKNPCTIAHPQRSLLSLSKIVLCQNWLHVYYIVLYTDRNITGHSNFVCVAYFIYFNKRGRRSSWKIFGCRPMQKAGNRCYRMEGIFWGEGIRGSRRL